MILSMAVCPSHGTAECGSRPPRTSNAWAMLSVLRQAHKAEPLVLTLDPVFTGDRDILGVRAASTRASYPLAAQDLFFCPVSSQIRNETVTGA